jgi:ubiquinone/menaquinone biosynthesis C-methylase UbiE
MPRTKPFDEFPGRYDDWFERNRHVYQSEVSAIGHFFHCGGRKLEIGVGSGRFAAPFGIGFGIDPSEPMQRLAKARRIQVCNAVAENLPFKGSEFDGVLIVTTICFVDDLMESFCEARRVLRVGGLIGVGFVDRCSSLGRLYDKQRASNVFYREASFYSSKEVLALLVRAGFQGLEAVQTVFGSLADIKRTQEFKEGYGTGGFVVARGIKV